MPCFKVAVHQTKKLICLLTQFPKVNISRATLRVSAVCLSVWWQSVLSSLHHISNTSSRRAHSLSQCSCDSVLYAEWGPGCGAGAESHHRGHSWPHALRSRLISQACGGLPASSLPSEEPPPITGSALLVAVVKPTELSDLQHYFPNNYNNNKTTHEHCEHWAGWFSSGCLILKSHIYYKKIVIYYFKFLFVLLLLRCTFISYFSWALL